MVCFRNVRRISRNSGSSTLSGSGPTMGASEKFCLKWNDFETNISGAFRELREEKDFFDVTLACDDSQIQAHKVAIFCLL